MRPPVDTALKAKAEGSYSHLSVPSNSDVPDQEKLNSGGVDKHMSRLARYYLAISRAEVPCERESPHRALLACRSLVDADPATKEARLELFRRIP